MTEVGRISFPKAVGFYIQISEPLFHVSVDCFYNIFLFEKKFISKAINTYCKSNAYIKFNVKCMFYVYNLLFKIINKTVNYKNTYYKIMKPR